MLRWYALCCVLDWEGVTIGYHTLFFFNSQHPAARENSNTSPFGTWLFSMASIVSGLDTVTMAVAIAFRRLLVLCVILTIIIYSLSIDRFRCQIIPYPKPVIPLLFFPPFPNRHQLPAYGGPMK